MDTAVVSAAKSLRKLETFESISIDYCKRLAQYFQARRNNQSLGETAYVGNGGHTSANGSRPRQQKRRSGSSLHASSLSDSVASTDSSFAGADGPLVASLIHPLLSWASAAEATPTLAATAMVVVRELAADEAYSRALVDAGAVTLLLDTLSQLSPDQTYAKVIEECCICLGNLISLREEARSLLVQESGLSLLLRLVRPGYPSAVVSAATGCLWVLALDSTAQQQLASNETLAVLAALCRRSASGDFGAATQHALGILRVITVDGNPDRIAAVIDLLGMRHIVALLRQTKDFAILEQVTFLLANLTEPPLHRVEAGDLGAVENLVQIVRRIKSTLAAGSDVGRSQSSAATSSLPSLSGKGQPTRGGTSTPKSLRLKEDSVDVTNEGLIEGTCVALSILTLDCAENQQRLCQAKGVSELCGLLYTCPTSIILCQIFSVFESVSSGAGTLASDICRQGCLAALLETLSCVVIAPVVAQAARALKALLEASPVTVNECKRLNLDTVGILRHAASVVDDATAKADVTAAQQAYQTQAITALAQRAQNERAQRA